MFRHLALSFLLVVSISCATTVPPASPVPVSEGLSPLEEEIVAAADARMDEAIELIEETVRIPSATTNLEGVREVGRVFARELEAMGFETRWIDLPPELNRAGHLFAEIDGGEGDRVLLIGHLDTVLESPEFRIEGNRAYGIGASDMKGGDVIIINALKALHDAGALEGRRIIVALIGDEEEAGRPLEISRGHLIEEAKQSDYALAFEGYVEGTATVARRGIGSWKLTTTAKTGHSSLIFREDRGFGAIFEAARIIDAFRRELVGQQYLTFNPSVIVGGTTLEYDMATDAGSAQGKTNVIPANVVVEGDLRFISNDQQENARAAMRRIVASGNLPQTSASIEFAEGYPAMAPTEGNYELLAELDQVSRDLGYGPVEPHDPGERGAADISFVSPWLPSLDGLGAMGYEEHAPGESIDLETIPMLVKRAALLIHRLTR